MQKKFSIILVIIICIISNYNKVLADDKKDNCESYFKLFKIIPDECKNIIVIPSFKEFTTNNNEKKLITSLKKNMYSFQVMLETYSVDWAGTYPSTVNNLIKEAKNRNYYKNEKNPFNSNLSTWINYKEYTNKKFPQMTVIYNPIKDLSKDITKYEIFASDKNGNILKENNKIYVMTNN